MVLGGVPNDTIQTINGVACVSPIHPRPKLAIPIFASHESKSNTHKIILVPVIQRIYPFLAKHKILFVPLARISVAFLTIAIAMAYAAMIQKLIYSRGPCYSSPLHCAASNNGKIPNHISVWVQVPIYFILAIAEILGFVSASEYTYAKAPTNMKSIFQALTQFTAAISSALGIAISVTAKGPSVLWMYVSLAVVMAVSAGLFWMKFWRYDKIDEELNELGFPISEEARAEEGRGGKGDV